MNRSSSYIKMKQWFWMIFGLMVIGLSTGQETLKRPNTNADLESQTDENSDGEEIIICEHADSLKIYRPDENTEVTVLTGKVRIKMTNGFLNAQKVTMFKDIATDTYQRTLAEENVELRDKDIFANCHQATINHIDNTIDLKKQVVVIQEDDRLEADHFIFNRVTGERIGEGNVKFRVRIRSTNPSELSITNGTNNDSNSRTGE